MTATRIPSPAQKKIRLMSEANTPRNSQSNSEPQIQGSSSWYSDWDSFFRESEIVDPAASDPSSTPTTETSTKGQQWETVNFPNAISADAIERQAMYTSGSEEPSAQWSARTIAPNTAAASVERGTPGDELDITQLISLIQELNQCNSALLDRVSQLEDALEQTQAALKTERQQVHHSSHQTLTDHQDQITQLFHELEQAHQTTQRQQILVENLTQQLTFTQERAAQLERDCALLQEQNQEQVQRLSHNEHICQDLRVRLQRQQQYTMQFKAALERCLEVPGTPVPVWSMEEIPSLTTQESVVSSFTVTAVDAPQLPEGGGATPPLVPKVRQIQPWSAQSGEIPLKLDALLRRESPSINLSDKDVLNPLSSPVAPLPSFDPHEETLAIAASTPVFDDTSLNEPLEQISQAVTEEKLASIHPFSEVDISPEMQAMMEEILKQPANSSQTGFDLWAHLAKLVDLPVEALAPTGSPDTADADLQAAEENAQPEQSKNATESPTGLPLAAPPKNVAQPPRKLLTMPFEGAPDKVSAPLVAAQSASVQEAMNAVTYSPSPIVYPLRPTKKIPSLAAVDLPTFPRS